MKMPQRNKLIINYLISKFSRGREFIFQRLFSHFFDIFTKKYTFATNIENMKNLATFLLVFFAANFAISCVRDRISNERLKETYYIGLDYLDNGDAPMALDYFQQCLEIAKEPGFDDMIQLSKVYSQMSRIYHHQKLPEYELDALNNAMNCALAGGDSILALWFEELFIKPYYWMGKKDSVIAITERVSKKYYDMGLDSLGNICQENALLEYIQTGQLDKAKRCIEIYESCSELFDENGDIIDGREIYYYNKGLYFLAIEENDSAEIYFHKLLKYKDDLNDWEATCRGLLMVYRKLNNIDSIGKYAQLYCEANDTVTMKYKSDEIARMHSLYNYNSHRIEAERLSMTVKKQRLLTLLISAIFVFLIVIISMLAYFYRKTNSLKMQNLEALYEEKLQQIDSLSLDNMEQESLISKLLEEAESLKKLIKKEEPNTTNQDSEELSALVARFHEAAKDPVNGYAMITSADWQGLFYLFEQKEHRFFESIHQKDLSNLELKVTLLMRLKFVDTEIMALLNSYGSTYSNCKTRINTKLFGTESAKGLRAKITLWK